MNLAMVDQRRHAVVLGPLRSLSSRIADSGTATGHPGSAQRAGEAVFASLRLPCAARARGPVAQLATLTSLAALRLPCAARIPRCTAGGGVAAIEHPRYCRQAGGRGLGRANWRRRGAQGFWPRAHLARFVI